MELIAPHDRLLILDFGSQLTQLIARRLRECGIYCEIFAHSASPELVLAFAPRGLIFSGGPASVTDPDAPRADPALYALGLPILGICYGQQVMVQQLGGTVQGSDFREFGRATVHVTAGCALFRNTWQPGTHETVWMSHGDRVSELPPGFAPVAASEGAPFAAIADEARHFYGTQFHVEVVHTPHGAQLLENFAKHVCGCAGDWSMGAFRTAAIARIRAQVGSARVICGLSGGVDSSVAAALIHEAIGDQLTCIFVDHGLLRAGEAAQVVDVFANRFNVPLVHRDAGGMFLAALAGVTDPEEKRRAIGRLFIDVFEEEAAKIGGADFLAQGTLYPDVIESVSVTGGPSVTNPTTTSEACPPECASNSSNLCATCSRTRCACSAANSACRKTWSGATRSPVRVLPFAFPAK
jgi:GMP synthase (glutamine-hydrolysing)